MKIAHFYPFLGRDKGGIAACLPPMLNALERENIVANSSRNAFAAMPI